MRLEFRPPAVLDGNDQLFGQEAVIASRGCDVMRDGQEIAPMYGRSISKREATPTAHEDSLNDFVISLGADITSLHHKRVAAVHRGVTRRRASPPLCKLLTPRRATVSVSSAFALGASCVCRGKT